MLWLQAQLSLAPNISQEAQCHKLSCIFISSNPPPHSASLPFKAGISTDTPVQNMSEHQSCAYFCPHINYAVWWSTLKGKNLLLKEQILSFKSRPPVLEGHVVQRSKHEGTKVVSIEKWPKKPKTCRCANTP